jgi:hypothetical protein
MKLLLTSLVCFFGIAGCSVRDTPPVQEIALTGRAETQRIRCDLPNRRKVVLEVRFHELETGRWKVGQIRVYFQKAKPIVLSESFTRGMWRPFPALDTRVGDTKAGSTTITLFTGGGSERASHLQISNEGKVDELSP